MNVQEVTRWTPSVEPTRRFDWRILQKRATLRKVAAGNGDEQSRTFCRGQRVAASKYGTAVPTQCVLICAFPHEGFFS